MNDFENCLENMSPNMYVDDTIVPSASSDLKLLLAEVKNELENISKWMNSNRLSLNASKSEFMFISHQRQLGRIGNEIPDLTLNDENIQRVAKTRYLGIQIDESLSWKEHYTATKKKLIGGLASLRRLPNILPQSKLENKSTF